MFVERLERATVDVPVQLFADQRQVDEFDERRLQLAYGATALVREMYLGSRSSVLLDFGEVAG
jgi:hypothetical protein